MVNLPASLVSTTITINDPLGLSMTPYPNPRKYSAHVLCLKLKTAGELWLESMPQPFYALIKFWFVTHLVDCIMSVSTHDLFQDLTSPLQEPVETFKVQSISSTVHSWNVKWTMWQRPCFILFIYFLDANASFSFSYLQCPQLALQC